MASGSRTHEGPLEPHTLLPRRKPKPQETQQVEAVWGLRCGPAFWVPLTLGKQAATHSSPFLLQGPRRMRPQPTRSQDSPTAGGGPGSRRELHTLGSKPAVPLPSWVSPWPPAAVEAGGNNYLPGLEVPKAGHNPTGSLRERQELRRPACSWPTSPRSWTFM